MASAVWLIALLVRGLCNFYSLCVRKGVYMPGEINSVPCWYGLYPPVIIYASEVWGGFKGCLTAWLKVHSEEISGMRVHSAILCHRVSGVLGACAVRRAKLLP